MFKIFQNESTPQQATGYPHGKICQRQFLKKKKIEPPQPVKINCLATSYGIF
jgi:hypothetical protein